MTGLGERLKELRRKHNISQAELSKQLNLSKSTIAGYETNYTSPSLESLCSLANFYNVSTDFLLGREKDIRKNISLSAISENQEKIINMLINDFKDTNLKLKE